MKKIWIIIIPFWVVGCSPAQEEMAPLSIEDLRIVYNVLLNEAEDNYEIFIMDSDGKNVQNLSDNKAVDWAYYAYEDKIYFLSDRDTSQRKFFLYEMDMKGKNIKRISKNLMADSWFNSRKNNSEFIIRPHSLIDSAFYLIDKQGNILNKINPGLPYFSDPTFSPDGEQIVFRGGRTKSKRIAGFSEELFIMNANGSGTTQLTRYPLTDTTAQWYEYHAGPPHWHPSGEYLTFQSKQAGKYSLYAVDKKGQQWKLTDHSMNEGYHSWSPDGEWLAVEVFDSLQTQFHIALIDMNSGEMNILTDTAYQYQQGPVFVFKQK